MSDCELFLYSVQEGEVSRLVGDGFILEMELFTV